MSILCFGNVQLDVLCRSVITLPPLGGIEKIDRIDFVLGGNGGNVSAVLGRLGLDVEIAGYRSTDMPGERLTTLLTSVGVGTQKLLPHSTAQTGVSIIMLAPNGERSIFLVNGVNEFFDLSTVPDQWLQGKHVVSVGSIFLLPQFTGEAIGQLFLRAHAHGSITVLNMCWDGKRQGVSFLQPALAEADYFVLNADEGHQLTGQTQPEQIVASLEKQTRGTVVLTLGAQGCCLRDGDQLRFIPALSVKATDSTGAGDSFVAGLIAGLASGRSVSESARLGCRVAAFAVASPGTYLHIPPLEEVDQLGMQ